MLPFILTVRKGFICAQPIILFQMFNILLVNTFLQRCVTKPAIYTFIKKKKKYMKYLAEKKSKCSGKLC